MASLKQIEKRAFKNFEEGGEIWIDGVCYIFTEEEFYIFKSQLQQQMKVRCRNVYAKNKDKDELDIEEAILNTDDII